MMQNASFSEGQIALANDDACHNHKFSDSSNFVRIKQIRMIEFRSFDDYTLHIPSGLVFVFGPNESGKTGVMEAIKLGLFTDASTRRQDVLRLAKWGTSEGFKIKLILENGQGLWEITRDFYTRRNVLNKPDGTLERDKNRILKIIASLFGIPAEGAEDVYMSSTCVSQDELNSRGDDLKKLVEKRILGAGVDVMKLARDADRRIRDLRAGISGGARQGEFTLAQNRVSDLGEYFTRLKSKVEDGQQARAKVVDLTNQVKQLDEEIALLEKTVQKAKMHAEADDIYEREKKQLREIINKIKDHKEITVRLDRIELEIKKLSKTKENLHEMEARKFRISQIEQKLATLKSEKSRLVTLADTVSKLVGDADNAQKQLSSFLHIDPIKVNEALKIHSKLTYLSADLQLAIKKQSELIDQRQNAQENLKEISQNQKYLVSLLKVKEMQLHLETFNSQLDKLTACIEEYSHNQVELSGLKVVSKQDVEQATQTFAKIQAMKQIPAGLDVKLVMEPEVEAEVLVDEVLSQDIESEITKFSPKKSFSIKVPKVIDLEVSVTDADEFFIQLRRSEEKLNQILRRYEVDSVKSLSDMHDKYQKIQQVLIASNRELLHVIENIGSITAGVADQVNLEQTEILDTSYRVKNILSDRIKTLKQNLSLDLNVLDIDNEGLEKLSVTDIKKKLETVEAKIQALSKDILGMKLSISSLELDNKQKAVKQSKQAIAELIKQARCDSLEEMVEKNQTLLDLKDTIRDKKSRVQDLLGGTSLEELNKNIGVITVKISELAEEKQSILGKGFLPDDLTEKLNETDKKLQNKTQERHELIGRLKNLDLEELKRKELDIFVRMRPAQHERDRTLAYKMTAEQLVNKELEFKNKQKRLERLKEARFQAQAEVNVMSQGSEDVAAAQEEYEDAVRHLEHIEREIKILDVLKQVFPRARTRAISSVSGLLTGASSKYINLITDGKYDRIKISKDFTPMLYSSARGTYIDVVSEKEFLSAGTLDQVLMAVRLAVSDFLSQGKCPPVVMDDPFIHFDSDRRKAAIEALKKIAQTYQVIVFTCHDYPELAQEQVVRLV